MIGKLDAMLANLSMTRRLLCWLAAGVLTFVATGHANAQIVLFVTGEPAWAARKAALMATLLMLPPLRLRLAKR